MPKMAVECPSVIVLIHELADASQIAPELFGSYGGIIPALPFRLCTGSKRGRTRPGLAYLPYRDRLAIRVQPHVRCLANFFQAVDELNRKLIRLVRVIGPEFHQQYPATVGEELKLWRSFPFESVDNTSFKSFQPDRMKLQYLRNMIGCQERIVIPQSAKGAMLRTVD